MTHCSDSGPGLPPRAADCWAGRATSGNFFFVTIGLPGIAAALAGVIADTNNAPAMTAARQTEGDFPGALFISQCMNRVRPRYLHGVTDDGHNGDS